MADINVWTKKDSFGLDRHFVVIDLKTGLPEYLTGDIQITPEWSDGDLAGIQLCAYISGEGGGQKSEVKKLSFATCVSGEAKILLPLPCGKEVLLNVRICCFEPVKGMLKLEISGNQIQNGKFSVVLKAPAKSSVQGSLVAQPPEPVGVDPNTVPGGRNPLWC